MNGRAAQWALSDAAGPWRPQRTLVFVQRPQGQDVTPVQDVYGEWVDPTPPMALTLPVWAVGPEEGVETPHGARHRVTIYAPTSTCHLVQASAVVVLDGREWEVIARPQIFDGGPFGPAPGGTITVEEVTGVVGA